MLRPLERLALLASFLCVFALVALTGGCPQTSSGGGAAASSSSVARATVRGSILILTSATRDAMKLCDEQSVKLAQAGDGEASSKLWRDCQAFYAVARPSLISAAEGVDAWTDASRGEVVCSALRAGRAVASLVGALEAAHAPISPSLDDARASADSLASMGVAFACPKS